MKRRDFIYSTAITVASGISEIGCSAAAEKTQKKDTPWGFEEDNFKTSAGNLKITFIGHGSYMFTFKGAVIYVDPWSKTADYSRLPKADIVLVSHVHIDHLDPIALKQILTDKSVLLYSEPCTNVYKGGRVTKYGDVNTIKGINIETVPAYNIIVKKTGSHPWGFANGYVLTFGNMRVYAAGETEKIPEMDQLKNIDIAFFSVDSVFNMTPEMAAEAAKVIMPKILYPIHFTPTFMNNISDLDVLKKLLNDTKEIEIRIRKME